MPDQASTTDVVVYHGYLQQPSGGSVIAQRQWTWRQHEFIADQDATTVRAEAETAARTCQAANPGSDVGMMTRLVTAWEHEDTPEDWMTNKLDAEKIATIEARLTSDTLTDDELVDALNEAGLPELARVVSRLAQRGTVQH